MKLASSEYSGLNSWCYRNYKDKNAEKVYSHVCDRYSLFVLLCFYFVPLSLDFYLIMLIP